jgi:hypothetical protein
MTCQENQAHLHGECQQFPDSRLAVLPCVQDREPSVRTRCKTAPGQCGQDREEGQKDRDDQWIRDEPPEHVADAESKATDHDPQDTAEKYTGRPGSRPVTSLPVNPSATSNRRTVM